MILQATPSCHKDPSRVSGFGGVWAHLDGQPALSACRAMFVLGGEARKVKLIFCSS